MATAKGAKKTAARKAGRSKPVAKKTGSTGKQAKRGGSAAKKSPPAKAKTRKPALLSGDNPQIAKGSGDAPVQAYIAAMPGWKSDIRGITEFDKLPKEAQDYVLFIEKELGVKIAIVSTGPKREEIIYR